MGKRSNSLGTLLGDQSFNKDFVQATQEGHLKWRILGGYWTTRWTASWRMYVYGSSLVFTEPARRGRGTRWVYQLSPQEVGDLLEAIIFSREEEKRSKYV